MKRFFSGCLLMLCLSFPALGGHTVSGGFYCDCTDPEHVAWGIVIEDEEDIQQNEPPSNELSELDIFIDVLLIMIRF